MVTEEILQNQLIRLEGAFCRTLTKSQKAAWWAKVRDWPELTFIKTIDKLEMGDSFPKFRDLFEARKNCGVKQQKAEPEGCSSCVKGRVHFWQYREQWGDVEVVGWCGICKSYGGNREYVDPAVVRLTQFHVCKQGGRDD